MAVILEVCINDEKFAITGEESLSVLGAHVSAVGKLGAESSGVKRRTAGKADIGLRVSGLTNRGNRKRDQHLNWGPRLSLKPGDEVRIVIREGTDYAPATERHPVQDMPHS